MARKDRGLLNTTIAYPWTVQNEQANLLQVAQATNTGIASCAALDAVTRSGWNGFFATITAFCAEEISLTSPWTPGYLGLGSRLDQIDSYADQLESWQKLLSQKCNIGTPIYEPPPSNVQQWLSLLEWSAVAAIAIAGAYGVGRVADIVVPLLPEQHPARSASERRRRR